VTEIVDYYVIMRFQRCRWYRIWWRRIDRCLLVTCKFVVEQRTGLVVLLATVLCLWV